MAKNNYKFSKTRKSVIAALCALTVTCTGLAAACSNDGDGDDSSSPFKREDTVQLLKNGSFESYSVPKDAVYLIKNTDGWSRGGDSSNAMSGIIGTSKKNWAALTEEGLSDKLDFNNDLSADDENYTDLYVDYNGMKTRDILYKDTYSALLEDDEVQDSYIKNQTYKTYFGIVDQGDKSYFGTREVKRNPDDENDIEYYFINQDGTLGKSVRYALIDNPKTHYAVDKDDDGLFFMEGSVRVAVYEDEDSGDYFYYADGNAENDTDDNKVFISNVLMVHNYPTDSKYNGIQQYYTSQTITLEANTAAEISLWVKTSDLKFDKGYSQLNDQDRGAFIEVTQTVNGSSVSSFKIKAINTEKIIADGDITLDGSVVSNGWLQYTVYVNACDFGDSTVTLNLGLGQNAKNSNDYSEKCTGYAFFDDVTVTKYLSLDDENCTYSENETKLTDTTCTLTTGAEEKIFIADRALSNRNTSGYASAKRNSEDFFYLVDLASENGDVKDKYAPVNFSAENTSAALTTEKDKSTGKYYASANTAPNTLIGVNNDFSGASGYTLPEGLKQGLKTSQDIIGAYAANKNFSFTGDFSALLNKDLLGEKGLSGLPKYDENGTANNLLLMFSAGGAAYTATVNDGKFTVKAGEYMIVSFWVKTSDMEGKTAATIKITNGDKDSEQSITLDSTGVKTDFDKDNKDIYNGWVQCFFFVENDTENDETFRLEFSFGNTGIIDTTVNSYAYGWAALANVQVLSFDSEDIYSLTSTGNYSKQFSFTENDDKENQTGFDAPSGTSNIKNGIAAPAGYDGVNGGSSAVAKTPYQEGYDEKNNNVWAGLINRDNFDGYADKAYILSMFNAANWSAAFENDGGYCYQPLVIVNTLRAYAENASANENTYADYYVETSSGTAGAIKAGNNKYYVKAASYDPDETYYSLGANYGFIGTSNSVGAESYQTVSVKVMVSDNAVAYVYLVDSNSRDVLGYTTPKYTFYYDDEGNVLDEKFDEEWTDSQHKNHVVYTLLDNGLYKDKDGNIRANLYNLTKAYKSYYEFQHNVFYTDTTGAEESIISFDKLVDGETYYTAEGKQADHYLVNSDGKRVYKFVDGEYFYIVDGKVSSQTVDYFEEKYAIPDAEINEDYFVEVGPTNGKWITVNFIIRTGSEAKDYRLELWSGARGETGDLTAAPKGAVAFDHSDFDINDEENFNAARSQFENEIIEEYKTLLKGHPEIIANENIEYYEKEAAKSDDIDQTKLAALQAKYKAHYYSYTLYDDPSYIPFNAETAADGETGYDYKITDEKYGERLAVLKYEDETSYNVFIDYSAVEQNVEIGTVTDDDDDETEKPETDWLIITSIILVVALLFALVSIVVRDLVKKLRKKQSVKAQSKNMYRKRERYIKKLHLVKNETEEEPSPEEPSEEE